MRRDIGMAAERGSRVTLACYAVLTLGSVLGFAQAAHAVQPLSAFLNAAREYNTDNKEAAASAAQRQAERGQAWMKLAPVLTATGGPTLNQYQTELDLPRGPGPAEHAVITPKYQRDAAVGVSLPLIDVGSFERAAAARETAKAAQARQRATGLDVEKAVVLAYYQATAAAATLDAAKRSQSVAEETLKLTHDRQDSGVASQLDVTRAVADVERAKLTVADADYSLQVAVRGLQTVSGLTPDTAAMPGVSDDLHEETALTLWQARVTPDLPTVEAARLERVAADKNQDAARAAYLPTLGANVAQHYTNAAGLSGHSSYYAATATLTWRLDPGTPYGDSAAAAAAAAAAAREERSQLDAADTVYLAWQQIRSQLVKSRAARAQDAATREAVVLMQQRYGAGTATLLDVSQAERDALTAEVARIQADGDLTYARALLRLSTGQSVEAAAPASSTN